jgi:uncharacterized protein (TIGR00297 family)
MSMLIFAFLLPFLTWPQAAGCAGLALFFNVFILPRLGVDLRKRPAAAGDDESQSSVLSRAENVWTGIVIYPVSVLGLILLYRNNMPVVAAAWAIMALGDGMASVAGEALRGPALKWNPGKTWWGLLGFVVAGSAGAYLLTRWSSPSLPVGQAFVVCVATAVVGAMVESLPIRLDDNLSVPLVSGGFMFCAYLVEPSALAGNLPYLRRRILLGIIVSLLVALLAWRLKTVTRSGAAAGFLIGVAVYLGYGYRTFSILISFFLLGSFATLIGYGTKASRGIAEAGGGARTWREALANGLAGAFFSVLIVTTHQEGAFLAAMVAAFAEAAGDTASSEIGKWLSDRAFLITTFQPVRAGENGGVTLAGTAAGIVASGAVVALGYALGLVGKGGAALAVGAAFAGNLLDSLLGATIERRGLVTNGIVNFAGSSFAGALALALSLRS